MSWVLYMALKPLYSLKKYVVSISKEEFFHPYDKRYSKVRANTWTDPSIYKIVADEGGYCIGGNSTDVFPAYGTLSPDFPGIQELVKYVSPYVTGQMCGTSAYGLNSIYSVPLFLLSEVVGYGEVNDGMVPLSSCQVFPDKPLSQVYSDSYYAVSANHAGK